MIKVIAAAYIIFACVALPYLFPFGGETEQERTTRQKRILLIGLVGLALILLDFFLKKVSI